MALQDQTLANTQAKMSLAAAEQRRKRNTEATFAAMRHGAPRTPSELPVWAQTMPLTPSIPGPDMAGAKASLSGLGGLLLGVAGQKAAMPDDKLLDILKVWELEGLSGVKRLVDQGVAPASLLEALKAQQLGETRPSGGYNGAPAGSGLPVLGV